MSVVAAVLIVLFTGILATNFIGRTLIGFGEDMLQAQWTDTREWRHRLPLADVGPEWTPSTPLRVAVDRRQALVEIDALVYEDTREMLSGHPAIARIHGIDRRWRSMGTAARLAGEWRLFRNLRARLYDLVIHLTEHPRGAWLARTLGCLPGGLGPGW